MNVQFRDKYDVVNKKYTKEYIDELAEEIIENIKRVAEVTKQELCSAITIDYDETLVSQILIDAIEDLKRIQNFHPVKNVNAIKEAAYIGYWWVRRKPVMVIGRISDIVLDSATEDEINKLKAHLLFINEFCVAHYVMPKIFCLDQEINYCATEANKEAWSKARDNLIYFLAYRADNPKSIEAVLSSYTLHPLWVQKQDFWLNERLNKKVNKNNGKQEI